MATVTLVQAFDTGNFWAAQAAGGVTTEATNYEFTNAAGYDVHVTGTGFTYAGNLPSGGTYTSIQVFDDLGVLVATYTSTKPIDFATFFSSGAATALASDSSFAGSTGNDTINGLNGYDNVLDMSGVATAVTVDLAVHAATGAGIGSDTVVNIETVYGGSGNDSLKGSIEDETFNGGLGDDTINGGGGVDTVDYQIGTPANSTVTVTLGNGGNGTATGSDIGTDTLIAIRSITGGNGGDIFNITDSANNTIGGEDGRDTISYQDITTSVTVNLTVGKATGADIGTDMLSQIEDIIGGSGDDVLIGDATSVTNAIGKNVIQGLAGNDTITGRDGLDSLSGGTGVDTVDYTTSSAGVKVDLSTQGTGDTPTLLSAGGVQLGGDAEGDLLWGFENLTGSGFADTLTGDAGANLIVGNAGNDRIDGGEGNDTLSGGDGNDRLKGAAGFDVVSYEDATGNVVVSLAVSAAQNTVSAGIDVLSGIEGLIGSSLDDTLTGDKNANSIVGGDGNDTVEGAAGADTLDGGSGLADLVSYAHAGKGVFVRIDNQDGVQAQAALFNGKANGDAAGDVLSGFEVLRGSARADLLVGSSTQTVEGGAGGDDIDAGTVSYEHSIGGVTIDLFHQGTGSAISGTPATIGQQGGDAEGDFLWNVANVIGSAAADTLGGDGNANSLAGRGGNDTILWSGGNDTLDGGANGRAGDTIDFTSVAAATNLVVDLSAQDGVTAIATGDVLSGFENIISGEGDDSLTGSDGNNRIEGGLGSDTIEGGLGDDTLIGGFARLGDVDPNTLSYAHAGSGVTVSLFVKGPQKTGGAGTDVVTGFGNLVGSSFGDVLTGDAGPNFISGGDGNDTIEGRGLGDVLSGDGGVNTVTYAHAKVGLTINLVGGLALPKTGVFDSISNFANAIGTGFADEITGDANDNVLEGGAGADTLIGGGGANTVSYVGSALGVTIDLQKQDGVLAQAGMGDGRGDVLSGFVNVTGSRFGDKLTGDTGDNAVLGGLGADTLTGDQGADTFLYSSLAEKGDHVVDFQFGLDHIDIAASGFSGLTGAPLTDNVDFITASTMAGLNATTAAATFLYNTATGRLFFDSDGSGRKAATLLLTIDDHATGTLTAADIRIV